MTIPSASLPPAQLSQPTSVCTRCGATLSCAMADRTGEPCWCAALPAAVPLPQEAAGCWCRACLVFHIAQLSRARGEGQA